MTAINCSICIPTYNGARHLRECLESAISQTHKAIEVLCIDDCSCDNTLELLNEYASRDNRIRIISNSRNLGLVQNWNECIAQSKGKWIKFLFQDDVIEPNCIQEMINAGEKSARPLVVARRDFIFENTPPSIVAKYEKFTTTISMDTASGGQFDLSPQYVSRLALRFHSENFIGEPTSTLILRDIFEQIGYFNSSMIQLCDLEFFLRVGTNYGLAYIPETLAHFRIHSQSTTSKNSSENEFLKDTIDPLLLYREFAFSEHYAALRAEAEKENIALCDRFYSSFVKARLALEAARQPTKGRASLNARIDAIESTFVIDSLPYRLRLALRLGFVVEHGKQLFNRHLGWRLRKQ